MIKKILTIIYTIAPIMLIANNIEITLEQNTSNPNPLDIIVKVTNTSDEDTFIETSHYPDKDGIILGANTFMIIEDGEKIPYIGPTVSAGSHPLKLKAGETYTTHANLKEFYQFTQGMHSYEIHYGDTDESNTLEMEANVTPIRHRDTKVTKSSGCSSNMIAILRGDQTRAQSYAQNVVNTLPTIDRGHTLYRKWFGYANSDRYNTVYVNYQKIYQGFNQNVTYTCFPSSYRYCSGAYQNTMAFVYKHQPFNINICPHYLNYNESSKSMALVHEMSHFNKTVGAVDGNGVDGNPYASNNGAQDLARIRPDLAIRNAYSYGYYAQELYAQGTGSNPGGGSTNSWTTGPYKNNIDTRRTLSVPKARKVTVTISGHLEQSYDFIYIYNTSGVVKRMLTGSIDTSFTVSDKSIVARLVTDGSVTSSGVTIKIKRKKEWWEFL